MPYYPVPAPMLLRPYWCPNCRLWYQDAKPPVGGVAGHAFVGCITLHAPGTCCHFGEERVRPQPPPPKDAP